MSNLTTELRQAIEKAGDDPVRIEDPETQSAYVLMKAEVYERIIPPLPSDHGATEQVAEGIRRSREAFLRDLPHLLTRRKWLGRWVAYRDDEQVGIASRPDKLLGECARRRLRIDEFYLGVIEPHSTESVEIERSFFEYDEAEPAS
jgi:hypothetical protein